MNSHDSVAHEADSRTATITTKRARDDTSLTGMSIDSSNQSTPRKRAKLGKKNEHRDLRDFVPKGASFSSSAVGMENDHGADFISIVSVSDHEITGPSLPSNTLPPKEGQRRISKRQKKKKNRKARATLPVIFDLPVPQQASQIQGYRSLVPDATQLSEYIMLPVKENQNYYQTFGNALKTVEALRSTFQQAIKKDKNNTKVRRELHVAEVNFAWCQYFPLVHKWQPFTPPQKSKTHKKLSAVKKARRAFWTVVERSMAEGTLLDLRAGKLGGVDECQDIELGAQYKDIKQAQKRYHNALLDLRNTPSTKVEEREWLSRRVHLALVDLNYCQFFPQNQEYQPLTKWRHFGTEIYNGGVSQRGYPASIWRLVEDCMGTEKLQELKDGRIRKITNDKANLSDEKLPSPDMPDASVTDDDFAVERQIDSSRYARKEPPPIPQEESDDCSASSDKVVTNIGFDGTDDKSQSGNTSESDTDHDTDHSGHSEDSRDTKDYTDSRLQSMNYPAQRQTPPSSTRSGARVLSELSPEDLNAQLRYFHFGLPKSSDNVPLDAEVRCLSCGLPGHMTSECEVLTCSECGTYNRHVTANCHTVAKCGKCREIGHKESACPYKLKKLARHEVMCELCKRNGHFEYECELFWRTSGCPWESDIAKENIRAFCYECGGSGHLGNDCPSRQPGKSMGTSTWSLKQAGPTPTITDEISIRGRAHDPPQPRNAFNQDPDPSQFHRPKPPQPSRKGKIKINVGNSKTIDHFPPPTWTPINDRDKPKQRQTSRWEKYVQKHNDSFQDRREYYRDLPVQSHQPPSHRPGYQNAPPSSHNSYMGHRPLPPPPPLPRPQQHNAHLPLQQMGQYQVQQPPPRSEDTYHPWNDGLF